MATPIKVQRYGDQMLVIMDDGQRYIAYPTGGSLWLISDAGSSTPGARFVWPFDLSTVTDEFGPRPPLPDHNGMDFGVPEFSIIGAMGDGVVTISQAWDGVTTDPASPQSLGNYIRIEHPPVGGNTLETGYAHMVYAPTLTVGTPVVQSQGLGLVGDTGYAFGVHLHLETWENGVRIDPRAWMTAYA